jgi:adenylate cyclase
MPDLIAQGAEPTHRWRRPVEEGHRYILGRAAGTWSTPWDPQISRRHAEISWREGRLQVEMLPESQNPIFVRGRQRTSFAIRPGEHFVIGATTFTLSSTRAQVSLDAPQPVTEQRYTSSFLQNARYRYADQRIDVLSRLPELIKGAGSDEELLVRLVNVLLAGIPGSSAVAIVDVESRGVEEGGVRVLHWDRRFVADGDFAPSAKLIRKAMEKQESVVHLWRGTSEMSSSSFTQSDDADWAFCVPIPGESCQGWGIYVAGHARVRTRLPAGASDPFDLRDELKFTELAAATISGLRDVRLLERHQASLRQFFSPVVLEALAGQDPHHALTPRETEVTVLFCDLRGFSRSAEQSSGNLLELLERVSQALGVMTHHILDQGGVVGDFHGDAAMGFWGWPLAVPQLDAVQRACRAALGIRRDFAEGAERDHSALIDFRVGIGIATGRAVAGRIGTIDQVKVTVFGPVVNLASRLESMTKRLQASILLDEITAQVARQTLVPEEARLRRVAKVQPYGMQVALEVSELLPTWRDDPTLTDENLAAYEAALDALLRGDWNYAFRLLHAVPADDRVKDFLTVLIAAHNRTPPPNWNGVIQLDSK